MKSHLFLELPDLNMNAPHVCSSHTLSSLLDARLDASGVCVSAG